MKRFEITNDELDELDCIVAEMPDTEEDDLVKIISNCFATCSNSCSGTCGGTCQGSCTNKCGANCSGGCSNNCGTFF